MKKSLEIKMIVIVMILLSMSWAVIAADEVVVDLSTALSKALENDIEFKLATLNYEKSELNYQKQKANYLLQQSRYNELEMEMSLASAKNSYQNTKNQLINSVISEYSNLWLSSLDLQIKRKNLQLEKMRLDEARAQHEIGDIGSIDLLEQENSYKDIQINLENAEDNYQQSIKEFRETLSLPDDEIKLNVLSFQKEWDITEDKAVKSALRNSFDLKLKADQLELARIDLERAEVSSAELDTNIKEKSVEIARLNEEQARNDLKSSTEKSYYQYKQAVKKLGLNQERLNSAEEKYKLIKQQYEVGLITSMEVLQYEINMLQSRYNYLSSVADYYQKEESLRQIMGIESEVLDNEISD